MVVSSDYGDGVGMGVLGTYKIDRQSIYNALSVNHTKVVYDSDYFIKVDYDLMHVQAGGFNEESVVRLSGERRSCFGLNY